MTRPPVQQSYQILYVSQTLLRQTHESFFPAWQAQAEAACLWCGVETDAYQVATTLAIPRLVHSAGAYRIERGSMRRLADHLNSQGLVVLAQLHTHPPKAGTHHSCYDDAHAYSTRQGALSLVWPDYGHLATFSLEHLGVHERDGDRWVRLEKDDVARRIRLVDATIDDRYSIQVDDTYDEK